MFVKYLFQFGFFPWTTTAYRGINADRPFALPNIVGVEKKDGYVHFDLVQLLALFFHRSILKVRAGRVLPVLTVLNRSAFQTSCRALFRSYSSFSKFLKSTVSPSFTPHEH